MPFSEFQDRVERIIAAAEQRALARLARLDPASGTAQLIRAADAALDAYFADLTTQLGDVYRAAVRESYKGGAERAALGDFTWSSFHEGALAELALRVDHDLARALARAEPWSRDLIRDVVRGAIAEKVLYGVPARGSGRALARDLIASGAGPRVPYRNGRSVSMRTYTDMVTRTATATAYNEGGLRQMDVDGIEYVEVIDGPDCGLTTHSDGFKADGKVITRELAASFVISHPNCRRDFAPRPDVTAKEAENAQSIRANDVAADRARFERQIAQQARLRNGDLGPARTPRQPRQARTPRRG